MLQTFVIYFLQSFMGFFYYAFYIRDFTMLRSYLFSRLVTNAVSLLETFEPPRFAFVILSCPPDVSPERNLVPTTTLLRKRHRLSVW